MEEFEQQLNKYSEKEYSEEEIKNLLDNLRRVGPEKPIGYLPISTLVDICKTDPATIEEELRQKGLKTIMLSCEESNIGYAGALFVYDEAALGLLLKTKEAILKAANWPTDPESFVRHLKVFAGHKTDLFDLVADAFGDKINPGRKNSPPSS